MDNQKMLAVLDEAYLGRVDRELESRVNEALDSIAATGEDGVNVLLERLYRDIRIEGLGVLRTNFYGDMAPQPVASTRNGRRCDWENSLPNGRAEVARTLGGSIADSAVLRSSSAGARPRTARNRGQGNGSTAPR